MPLERVEGRSVLTVEGIPEQEKDAYVRGFAEAGAVQCGFCTPGMVLAAKALLDRKPDPTPQEVRAGLRRNLCRCTGYAKIVDGVLRAGRYRRGAASAQPPREPAAGAPAAGGLGSRMTRVDAVVKARGEAMYVDDFVEPGMLFGAALGLPTPARSCSPSMSLPRARSAGVVRGRHLEGHPRLPVHRQRCCRTGPPSSPWERRRATSGMRSRSSPPSPPPAPAKPSALIRAEYEVLAPVGLPRPRWLLARPLIHPGGTCSPGSF